MLIMINPKEKTYRYGIYDFDKHALVGQFNEGGTAKARYLVAEHYRYLRCNRSSLCKMFNIIGSSKSKVFKWLLKHSVNNRMRTKNIIRGSQREIAKAIGISKNTVCVVVKQLEKNKMAVVETDLIILSPMLFFCGNDNEFLGKLRHFKYLLPNNHKNNKKSHSKAIKHAKVAKLKKELDNKKSSNKRQRMILKEEEYADLLQRKLEKKRKEILNLKFKGQVKLNRY